MRRKLLLAITLPTMWACASSPSPTPDTPAQLVDCSVSQRARPAGATIPESVKMEFTVDENGQPLVGTARVVPSNSRTPDLASISDARNILGTCVFEPALKDGEPVSSRHFMQIVLGRR